MESEDSVPQAPWDFSLYACTAREAAPASRWVEGDLACRLQSALQLELRPQQSSALPVQPASSLCKELLALWEPHRCRPGRAVVPQSGQPTPHFVVLRGEFT